MAHELLADGRQADVAHMLEPLVEEAHAGGPTAQAEQAMVRALLARIRVLREGRAQEALTLLAPYEDQASRAALRSDARAAVACAMGWARAWRDAHTYNGPRALALLHEAETTAREESDSAGTCWALLGQAVAYTTIDEFALVQEALRQAETVAVRIEDALATAWTHHLRILDCAFQGTYEDGLAHAATLQAAGKRLNDALLLGHGLSYEAALRHELGHPPTQVVATAAAARHALDGAVQVAGYPFVAALRAEASAHIRAGHWTAAERAITRGADRVTHYATGALIMGLERAHLHMARTDWDAAGDVLRDLTTRLPYRESRLLACRLQLAEAFLHRQTFAYDRARTAAEQALQQARRTGHQVFALRALLSLLHTAVLQSDLSTADKVLEAITPHRALLRLVPLAADWFRIRGRLADAQGDVAEATVWHRQALVAADTMGHAPAAARQRLTLACHAPAEAHMLLEEAAVQFDALAIPELPEAIAQLRSKEGAPVKTSPWDATLADDLYRAALSPVLIAQHVQRALQGIDNTLAATLLQRTDDGWQALRPGIDAPPLPPRFTSVATDEGTAFFLTTDGACGFALYLTGPASVVTDAWEALGPWRPLMSLSVQQARLYRDTTAATGRTDAPEPTAAFHALVAGSPAMTAVLDRAARLAHTHSPVLLTGEPGTGKRTLADRIHRLDAGPAAPCITVDCTNIEQDRLDGRLFGHGVPAASASAGSSTACAFARADGGTLVLHQVHLLPRDVQKRLVYTLREGTVPMPGAEAPLSVDVRIIATSTEALDGLHQQIDDVLLDRLSVLHLHLPPLRDRRDDIPLLVRHLMRDLLPTGSPLPTLSNAVRTILQEAPWPGNIRQLRNEIERAVAPLRNEPAPMLDVGDLSPDLVRASQSRDAAPAADTLSYRLQHASLTLSDALADVERTLIRDTLARFDGQVAPTADALGLTRQGLYKKIDRLKIDLDQFRHPTAAA
jgi:DNA-binding NtrC family response regulator